MSTLLAADVGNTNVVFGAYDGSKLLATWRTATRNDQTEDELAVMVDALLGREQPLDQLGFAHAGLTYVDDDLALEVHPAGSSGIVRR